MKKHIGKILPVLLALALPGLGLFIGEGNNNNTLPLLYQWCYISFTIYMLWHLLSVSWRFKPIYKQLIFLIFAIIAFTFLMSAISNLAGIKAHLYLEIRVLIRELFLILIFLTIQFAIQSQKTIDRLKVEKEQLAKENYKAQLQSLRNQMDPHFLFNSLNTLRSMIRQNHDNSEEFVIGLSDFYRQILKHNENTTLPLSEELKVLKSYLFVMKNRNEKALEIDIDNMREKNHSYRLPTLTLQSVSENCFKHNSMSSKMPLVIKIKSISGDYIEISNNVQPKITQEGASGHGLELLKKRYQLLGIKKGVIVTLSKTEFKVKLKLITPDECINC